MKRRDFLKLAAAGALVVAGGVRGEEKLATSQAASEFDSYFLMVLAGFLENAKRTSSSFAVCDFAEGTKLKSCVTPGGKTYVSVARMLPAMAEWARVGRGPNVDEVLLAIYRNAFDPKHEDYWGEPPKDKPTQRSVEAALVSFALHRLGEPFVEKLSSKTRSHINQWLSSCTVVPERTNNHAWFTAINQAARLELSKTFKEFHGDEKWMMGDLAALDALYPANNDGWYSDSPDLPVYDYYNFWTFANFPLYWSRVIGKRYPEHNERFRGRVKLFLQKAPYFFAADGSPPLFGRSLIYRFSMLAPLVDGYREGIWPHSVGMLKRIVRKTMEFHFRVGGFDERLGKLRETFSPGGTVEVKEAYIDNGHPYWAMQGFSFLSLPKDDPFWTAEEEPLPVEKEDFATRFEGPKMLVVGTKSSGQVKWIQAKAGLRREYYRDKYIKFSYSSAFPFNVLQVKGRCPWDQTLVFRDKQSGECVGRSASTRGEVLPDGVQTHWAVQLGKLTFEVTTRLRIIGEFEERTHAITAPAAAVDRVEFLDGSYPLGLRVDEKYDRQQGPDWTSLRSDNTGLLISWKISGYDKIEVAEAFEEKNLTVNIAHPRMAVISANGNLSGKRMTLGSLHYASPKPMDHAEVLKRGGELVAAWKADA